VASLSAFGENWHCADSWSVFCDRADGQIYIWHRDSAELVSVLSGHGPGLINAVSWTGRGMFASASDDHTVRVWGARPTAQAGLGSNGLAFGDGRLAVA